MADVIEQFLDRYNREFDFYDQAGRLAQAKLELTLQEAGIRAIVTSRPKSLGRLREKCRQRAATNPYESVEQIYNDIVDLVGIRIALYFPGEREQVDGIVKRMFKLDQGRKNFPVSDRPQGSKRFSGYSATHYRVRLQERELADSEHRYSLARIEIQVASVLMHAWSEVEHDLVYKPLAGVLSDDEHAILDQLNGLVLAGEISLERLQEAGQRRITTSGASFSNHYDLANYLLSHAAKLVDEPISDAGVGRMDLLYGLLRKLGITTAVGLAPYVEAIHGDLERRPLAEQLVDSLLNEDPSRFDEYQEVRHRNGFSVPDSQSEVFLATGQFLSHWNELERLITTLHPQAYGRPMSISSLMKSARQSNLIHEEELLEVNYLRRFRNELVHGIETPTAQLLRNASEQLKEIVSRMRDRLPPADGRI